MVLMIVAHPYVIMSPALYSLLRDPSALSRPQELLRYVLFHNRHSILRCDPLLLVLLLIVFSEMGNVLRMDEVFLLRVFVMV
jgi:hypothetical protein